MSASRALTTAITAALCAGCAASGSAVAPPDAALDAPPVAPPVVPPAAPAPPAPRAPAPAPTVRLPDSVDFQLPNGLRVFLVPSHEVPLVTLQVRVAGGSVEDPAGRQGAAALLAALLGKGAGERDAQAFQEAVDFVGGQFGVTPSQRWTSVSAEFLSADAGLGLDLLRDVLQRPRLDPQEFEKERGLAIDSIAAARDEPNAILGRYWTSWVFRGHTLARPVSGDENSLAALAIDDVRAAAARQLAPQRVWMAVAGDFDPAAMRREIESRFGAWARSDSEPPALPPPPQRKERGVLLVDMPDAIQTYFHFGNHGIDWSHPDYPARHLANTVLGGRFTSRLNTALRVESGLTYGAGSAFEDHLLGVFRVGTYTATDKTKPTFEMAESVYRKFVAEGMTAEELDSARSYVKGQYAPQTVETPDQAAGMILALEFDGLSRDVVNRFFERLDALTPGEVNRVIRERFPSEPLLWVVIGRAEVVRELAAKAGPVTEIPLAAPGFGPVR